ncbi:hypothetical protein HOK51_03330 [Candidatus Woesearchaeota archaeon]|jgi:hypothetical protein|nr:hypothetical protein [Candidatus Woesearchaeota archaeon]MBT6518852.1 hypothetical protein [Candidatus Woesearchaeota archaeon]MBT7367991.1 hypothetical protein [Candidatus Woesearchaeota archaeon]
MTLILVTETHGEVSSGFCATFTQFSRLGEYCFTTKHLCELIQHIAENKDLCETKILSFDESLFWKKDIKYTLGLLKLVHEEQESEGPINNSVLDKYVADETSISQKEELQLYTQGTMLDVIISDSGNSIQVGEYTINSTHFGRFADYLTHGGFMGWNPKTPKFATTAKEAMEKSKHPLYSQIQQELINPNAAEY